MNSTVIGFLTEYMEIYQSIGDIYREAAYTKAIPVIRRLPYKITKENVMDLAKLRGIGKGITEKITSFLDGITTDFDNLKKSPLVIAHKELGSILGVGPKTVNDWVNIKITTIPKLKKAISEGRVTLNSSQTEGLKYYDDLKKRIPRSEVRIIGEFIDKTLRRVTGDNFNSLVFMEIVGSYRRGSPDSGDIDIIITSDTYKPSLLNEIKSELMKCKCFVSSILSGKERTTILLRGPTGIVRQTDLLYVKKESYPAALLYFTGGWEFNEYMRGFAKSKGFRLNQKGLFKLEKTKLIPINVKSEEEIFEVIGMKYLDPKQR